MVKEEVEPTYQMCAASMDNISPSQIMGIHHNIRGRMGSALEILLCLYLGGKDNSGAVSEV